MVLKIRIATLFFLLFSMFSLASVAQTLTVAATTTTGSFKVDVSNVYSWTIQELVAGSWTGLASGTVNSNKSFTYTRPLGTYTFRLYNCPNVGACTYSASKSINVTKVVANFDSALWRLASRQDLNTLKFEQSTNALVGTNYLGVASQHWRIAPVSSGSSSFKIKNEETQQCLAVVGNTISLANCNTVSTGLISNLLIEKLRNRSEAQPALYHVRIDSNRCILPNSTSLPVIGSCNDSARWYIEPVWYGERIQATQYDVKALLIVKPSTNVVDTARGLQATGTVPQDIINAAQVAFKDNAKYWLERATDGAVTWNADSVVANEPIRYFHYDTTSDKPSGATWWTNPISGASFFWNISTSRFEPVYSGFNSADYGNTNFLPAADKIPNDVQRFVPRGVYDTVQVFFTGGTVPGGWGWGPGRSPQSNYTLWTTVNGGITPASKWLQKTYSDPTEVFIHEMLHGLDSHYYPLGIQVPDGGVHGSENVKYDSYKVNSPSYIDYGWMHWYRDYWLGTVIGTDDTYRGLGPRMFRLQKVRDFAAGQPASTIKITQNTSGKCLATKNGVITPTYGTEVVYSSTCNTDASSFQLNSNGMLEFKGSSASGTGFCVHPYGGTANVGTLLVLWGACTDVGLPVKITDYGTIQNISTGLCIRPNGGSSTPAEGTNAVYWNNCNSDSQRFKFNRQ